MRSPCPAAEMKILVCALYMPVLAGIVYYLILCGMLLAHRDATAAYGLLYAGVLALLSRRVWRIWRGETTGAILWLDAGLLAAADTLLAFIVLR